MATSDPAPNAAETFAGVILARNSAATKAEIIQLFNLLPKEVPSRGGPSHDSCSFSCGAYAKGGLQGLRSECATFKNSTKVIASFVAACLPDHPFTTASLFHNTKTDLHVDSRNHHSPNGVIPVTSFEKGGIWVADGCGPHVRQVNGSPMQGSILDFSAGPITFDAYRFPHQTEAWQGDRLVCVAFTVSSLAKLSLESARLLLDLGFRPPPTLPFPITVTTQDQPPVKPELWVYEFFAGTARFCKACRDLGFKVLGFDSSNSYSCSAVAKLDLTQEPAQRIVWDLLATCRPFHVHAAPPCGTASRARERPLPRSHFLASRAPKPLRSSTFPLGLPSLAADSLDSLRVRKANGLYRFVFRMLLHCARSGINVSVENPCNSWFWDVLQCFAEGDSVPWPPAALEFVDFDQCCHGSDRPKSTRFLCTRGLFSPLQARCPGTHVHKPWGLVYYERSMRFASSLEAAYPPLLCKRMAACLESASQARGLSLSAPADLTAASAAATGRQTRKFPPLIPEFASISWEPPSFQPDAACKVLLSHSSGGDSGKESGPRPKPLEGPAYKMPKTSEIASASSQGFSGLKKASSAPGPSTSEIASASSQGFSSPDLDQQGFLKVGRYLSAQDHVAKALTLKHPVDTVVVLDPDQTEAIDFCMKHSDREILNHRKLEMLKIRLLAKKLESDGTQLHSSFEPWFEKVVKGKRLLLWKHLLQQIDFDDMGVTDFMTSGVPLTGTSDCPSPLKSKVVPATLTELDLRSTAAFRRRTMSESSRPLERDLQALLSKATAEEVDLGFLEGPFTEAQVSSAFNGDDWNCIRRFLILQGTEGKPRPIDDGHEALVNSCYTSCIKLELQTSDFVTCMATKLALGELARAKNLGHTPRAWLGKCLDLSKAYKQMPMTKKHRALVVVCHKGEAGEDQFYLANAILFGLTASVYSFVRTSRSLHKLLTKIFKLPSTFYFDDFPMFDTAECAAETDSLISEFMDLLGWNHAKTGSKAQPFSEVFSVLGMQIDLSKLSEGSVILSNKPGRIDRIVERLSVVSERGRLTVHEAQVLLGLLNFSSGFFAGRALKQTCRWLSGFLGGDQPSEAVVRGMCRHAITILRQTPPRFITCNQADGSPVLVWTDGSWEPKTGFAGLGSVVLDTRSGIALVQEGSVPSRVLRRWREEVGDQIICEIELYAVLMTRAGLQNLLAGRRVIFFIDNEAARSVIIRGLSKSHAMHHLAIALAVVEASAPCIAWAERVPSASNIADYPSRKEGWKAQRIVRASKVDPFFEDPSLIDGYLL